MAAYVIIEKRDFDSLFEIIDINGSELTAINAKTQNKTKKTPRLSLQRASSPEKCRKKRKLDCVRCQSRSKHRNGNQSTKQSEQHTSCIPSTESYTNRKSDTEFNTDSHNKPSSASTSELTSQSSPESNTIPFIEPGNTRLEYTSSESSSE